MIEAIAGRRRQAAALIGLLLAGAPLSVEAKGNCDAQGGLFYLGNSKEDTRSIWLSATSPGSFRLEAAQGNSTVDQWSRTHRGLNITASPFVSQGNGGVHRLFDTSGSKECLMDTQNQKGGIPIPPHIIIPTIRPNGYIPLPRLPTIHPTGYIPLPKLLTIHPTGYIPLPNLPTIHPTGYIFPFRHCRRCRPGRRDRHRQDRRRRHRQDRCRARYRRAPYRRARCRCRLRSGQRLHRSAR